MLDMSLFSFVPGLQSRKKLWKGVHKAVLAAPDFHGQHDCLKLLNNISVCADRLRLIPIEWRDIYFAMYDESIHFEVDSHEKVKIDKDIHRTFGLFSRNIPSAKSRLDNDPFVYYDALYRVLVAITHERTYCQGLNFLVASFLLSSEGPTQTSTPTPISAGDTAAHKSPLGEAVTLADMEREAFTLLSFLLKQRHLEVLFNSRCSCLVEYMKLFEKKLRKHNRPVYVHFQRAGFGTVCYAIEWFTTCFVVTNPGLLSACVVDLLLSGFEDTLLRVGLAVIDVLAPRILSVTDLEQLQMSFKSWVSEVDCTSVLVAALCMELDNRGVNYLQVMYSFRALVLFLLYVCSVCCTVRCHAFFASSHLLSHLSSPWCCCC